MKKKNEIWKTVISLNSFMEYSSLNTKPLNNFPDYVFRDYLSILIII